MKKVLFFTLLCGILINPIFSQNKSWDKAPKGNIPMKWLQYYEGYFYYNDLLYSGFAFELHRNKNLKAEFPKNPDIRVKNNFDRSIKQLSKIIIKKITR